MDILKRHSKSTVLLGLYFLWWTYIIYYCFGFGKQNYPVCDFSPMAIIFISLLLGFIYSIGFLIKSLSSKEPERTDFLIFIGLITTPLIIGGLYVMTNA